MNIDLQLGNLFHNCSQNLKQARILDNLPIDQRGPLHGIPFSVKEHFHFKGRDSTAGLYQLIGQTAKQNAQIGILFHCSDTLLLHRGCIIFVTFGKDFGTTKLTRLFFKSVSNVYVLF